MKEYTCLNTKIFQDKEGYQILSIRLEDIEKIRQWRNTQVKILRQQTLITFDEQQAYFQQIIWPTFEYSQPSQILFSFLLNGECIGYGGLTHIDWISSRAEVSFLVDPNRTVNPSDYHTDYSHFLNLLCQAAFEDLHLHRLFAETFAFRQDHMKVLEDFGFKPEGILREHVYKQENWYDSFFHGLLANEWGSHAE